jgi:hypothetical protein
MLQVIIKDSKKHERTLRISGFVKPSGAKVAKVVNDQNEPYFVQIRKDGTTTCRHANNNEECKGHKFTGYCYHVKAVKSADLPTFEEVTATPDQIAAVAEERNMKKLAEYRRHVAENAYEVLATTKQVARKVSSIEVELTRRGLMK